MSLFVFLDPNEDDSSEDLVQAEMIAHLCYQLDEIPTDSATAVSNTITIPGRGIMHHFS